MPMCVRGFNVSFGIDIHEANRDPSFSWPKIRHSIADSVESKVQYKSEIAKSTEVKALQHDIDLFTQTFTLQPVNTIAILLL